MLAEAGDSIERFVRSGIAELGPKLGPIVWQFAPTKRFDAADFGAFLQQLPAAVDGVPLRQDRKSTRLNSSHFRRSRMPSSA